ncbi:hypothetical protein EAH_00063790, partial [Eimeria acervulina]
DDSNTFSEVAVLSKNWGSSLNTPKEEREDEGGPLAQRLQAQLAAAKQQLAAAKEQLATSETQRETLQDKLRTTEQERDKEKDKRITLEIQLERKKDNLVNEFMSQTDELEKTIARLKTELETEKRERKKHEEKLKQRVTELEDELEVVRAEARRGKALENLEEKLLEARSLGELLQSQKDEVELKLAAAEKKAEVAQLTLAQKDAEIDAKTFEVEALQEELEKARKNGGEAVAASPKQVEGDKEALVARIAALESELDDAMRLRKRLEKAQGVALSQLQLLQKQQEKVGDKEQQQQQQQINQLVKQNAELEATVKDLTESKDQLTKQLMQLFSKNEASPDA